MGKALYRKYRSKSLSEIVGQEHITDTLERSLKKGLISHAYLLTGPRGVGKTSIARILAYEMNSLPYDEEATHLDIIEIDAASNRRIDEIRELNDRIHIAPTSAKYKVYIIDEVHMLTKEAFNALLKTLEEPPEHAIFILATTEIHKVPETIQSRTQRFTFKPVDREKVVKHLASIAKEEKIVIDTEALELIADHGEGSFRDSISLLDQVRHSADKVALADVQRAIGQAPNELMEQLVTALASHDLSAVSSALTSLHTHGIQAAQVAKQLATVLRQDMLAEKPTMALVKTVPLTTKLLTISSSSDPVLALELALYGSTLSENTEQRIMSSPVIPAPEPEPRQKDSLSTGSLVKPGMTKTGAVEEPASEPDSVAEAISEPETFEATPVDTPSVTSNSALEPMQSLDETMWPDVLAAIKAKYNTLYGITRMAVPVFESEKITLTFSFPFHQKRLADPKNKQLLSDIITEITGKTMTIEILLNATAKPAPATEQPVQNNENADLKNISNIFGTAEIVN